MRVRRAALALLALGLAACGTDRATRALLRERNQLLHEVAGLRLIENVADSGLVRHPNEIVVSVRDTVVRALLEASLPVALDIPGDVTVRLTGVTMRFRSNVALVTVTGTARRTRFPRTAARLTLQGALEDFMVDSARALHTRIRVDDADLEPSDALPGAMGTTAARLLENLVDRALPQITRALPDVALPVRFDHALELPGFGPDGALAVEPAGADLTLTASRVLAYQDRLTVVLRLDRGPFTRRARDRPTAADRKGTP